MRIRGLASLVTLAIVLLLSACGSGSGRSNTADLEVVATAAPSSQANGGDVVAFVMTVTNNGPFSAENVSIRNVTQQVSASALSITCASSGGASCPGTTGSQMSVSSMPSGGRLVFTISGNANLGASGTLSDTMTASSDTTDGNSANNSATATGTVVSNDVAVAGTAPTGPLVSGTATYTMTVTNAGPNTANGVVLTTTTSSDLTLVPSDISCVPSGGASGALLQPDGTLLVSEIPEGGSLVCSVPVTVNITTTGYAIVSMTATVAGDARTSNNSANASVNATLTNDVGVTVTAPTGPLTAGSATFTAVVTNSGPAAATNVIVTSALSNATQNGPIDCTSTGGASDAVRQSDTTLLVATLPVSATVTCSIPVNVATGTVGNVSDTVTVSAAGDTHANNNSARGSVSATLNADLAVTGTAASGAVIGGQNTSFTMVVTNNGPAAAADVTLTNTLSSDLTLSGSITCTPAGGASTPSSGSNGITVSAMPVGSTVTCVVPVSVNAGANGTVVSTFTANSISDSQTRNNTASVSTVANSASLSLSQSGPVQIVAGNAATFTAQLTNAGPSSASNVQITWSHTTNSGLVFDNPTCAASSGATCPTTLGPTMSVASLPVGRTLTFSFRVTPSASFRGTVSNTVTAVSTEDTVLKTSTASATVVDAKSGTYSVFAADGQAYSLVIDFDARTYTMSGGTARTFAAPVNGDYVVSGGVAGERLRVAEDVVVGTHAFDGSHPLPYVAARSFVGNLTGMAGTYNLASRTVTSGVGSTHVGTAQIANGVLSICQTDTAQVQTVTACSAAGARKDYLNLVVNSDDTVTGVTAGGEAYTFVVANSGATKLLLSARQLPGGSTRELRIGLPDSTARLIAGPPLSGPGLLPAGGGITATSVDWISGTLTVGSTSSVALSGLSTSLAYADNVSLNVVNPGTGPFSMLTGTSAFYTTESVYLMQGYPIVVVVGGSASFGGADGLLQILVP